MANEGSGINGCDIGRLRRVLVKHPREAFVDAEHIDAQWKNLRFTAAPLLPRAIDEYEELLAILRTTGAAIEFLPADDRTTIDSIYTRDASVICDRGAILCRMGKRQREGEPFAQEAILTSLGIPVVGAISEPGRLEGGDVVWFDERTVAVGCGYRTNEEGIRQLRAFLAGSIDELVVVPLPHWRGPDDVFHVMSLVSPVDRDLAVVFSPLVPVPFRQWMCARGIRLVEVPDGEFDSMGTNVLVLEPGRCLMLEGNPQTRRALERAGVSVVEYKGTEINVKGGGGPTCITRPLSRDLSSAR